VIFKKNASVACNIKLPGNYFLKNIPATDYFDKENQPHLRVSSPLFRLPFAGFFCLHV